MFSMFSSGRYASDREREFDRRADAAVGFEEADAWIVGHEAAPVITPTFLLALEALDRTQSVPQVMSATVELGQLQGGDTI